MTTPKNESQTPRMFIIPPPVTTQEFLEIFKRLTMEMREDLHKGKMREIELYKEIRQLERELNEAKAKLAASPDANVESIRAKLLERSKVGLAKYGVTTERTDLDTKAWLKHLQEELMDAAVYCEAAMSELEKSTTPKS